MRRVALVAILAAVLAAEGFGCKATPPPTASVESPAPFPRIVHQAGQGDVLELSGGRIPGLTTTKVQRVDLPGVLQANGQIAFDDRRVSTIVSRVAGRIQETRVSQWDHVRRGEPILQLYSPDLMTAQAEYLQAQTTLRLTSAPQIGGQTLASGMLSAARRKLQLLGMTDQDIALITLPSPSVWIRAPIGGTVIDNKAMRGAQVGPGDVLYTLGSLDDVWITADIYEDDLARVHEGQSLQAITPAYPNESFGGFISRISPNIDPATHTLQIRCQVNNPGLRLRPQMLARVTIESRPGEALVVPQEALVFDTDRYFAFVEIADNIFARHPVAIASWKQEGLVRIVTGLSAGDRVVVSQSLQVNALWHQANHESS